MKLPNWMKRKESAVNRVLTFMLPLRQGIPTRTDYESLAREGYAKNSVVYSCVKEIAEAAAGIPLILYERKRDGDLDEIMDHPLLDLMNQPNPLRGRFEFIEEAISFLELSGNAYIEKVSAGTGPVRELYNLRPDRVTVVPHPVHLIGGYKYKVGGQERNFESREIQHTRLFHPTDDWYGLSPVQVAALGIDKINEGDKWNASLLANSAVPSGAMVTEASLTDPQFERLKSEMREQIQGVKNAREPLLLENGLNWKELGINPRDMDWIEGLKFSSTQIAQIFNVPPELIGLLPATYQNRKEARKALYTETACPALQRLIDGMNVSIVPAFGEGLFLAMNKDGIEALSEDQDSLWKRANESDFLTVNEKRQLVGFEDLGKEGDVVLTAINLLPLSAAIEGTSEEGAEELEEPDLDEDEIEEDKDEKNCPHSLAIPVPFFGGMLIEKMHPQGKQFSPKDRKRFRREFIEVARMREGLARRYRPGIQKQFRRELDRVVQAYRRGGAIDALDAVSAQEESWRRLFEDLHLQALKTFGVRTLESLKSYDPYFETKVDETDRALDVFETTASKFAKARAAQAVTHVSGETRKVLKEIIAEAVSQGLGIDEVVGQVKDKYADFSKTRARRIARTEIHNAQNEGQLESVRSLGRADMEKGWLWSGVSRSEHAAIDGTWVPMEEKFTVPSADAPMDRPGDPAGGPQAVVNCSCTLVFRRAG